MNVFAKFNEIPSMILQDIKETKRYGHKNVSDKRSFGQHEQYTLPQTQFAGGIIILVYIYIYHLKYLTHFQHYLCHTRIKSRV